MRNFVFVLASFFVGSVCHAKGALECFIQIDEAKQSAVEQFQVPFSGQASGQFEGYTYSAKVGSNDVLVYEVSNANGFEMTVAGKSPNGDNVTHLFVQTADKVAGKTIHVNCTK